MAVTWTKEQQKVIDYRNRDILVSAAAGSGKTAVLVERILKRITDKENPIDIDRLLVVTFTRAAASEMRERIGAAIEKACEKNPEDFHLRRQSALVHSAMIATIDSFCLFVVRGHFGDIGLDPNFRIADEGEIKLLELDVLDEVFEANYAAGENEAFLRLIDRYAGKRSDDAVKDMVRGIYRMAQSSPWPNEWIGRLAEPYQVSDKEALFGTELFRDITDTTKQILSDLAQLAESLLALAAQADGPAVYAGMLQQEKDALEKAADSAGYEALSDALRGLALGKLPAARGFCGDVLKKEAVMNGRKEIKKELEDIKKRYFSLSVPEMLEQTARLSSTAEELVRLTGQYLAAMAESKKKKRLVDFSDIEHFALRILVDEETKQPKPAAEEYRAHFEEIMIDEYQDSNQVQEEILRAISREADGGHNRFMVGDVKQSIYRFRLARPELFMEKYASFTAQESDRQRIDLHQNFRSRREVLDFCNDVFFKIMSPDLGRVSYDDDAALYCGADYPSQPGMEAELLLLDEADALVGEQKADTKRELEACLVADRIHRLMADSRVFDGASGELRPLRYSDIVILMRSLRDWGADFARVLAEHGIPAHVESAAGYFSALEVQTVLNMLKILDNPYQDIPMAAVLSSPIAGLDEEELAEVRVKHPDVPFAAAALAAMQEEKEGSLARFYACYCRLRVQRDLPVHELIQKVLDETGYANYAAAMPAGEKRSANLAMLIEKAIDYEKTSYRGLFHFVRYIDQLQSYEIDFGEADTAGENADVVHIMTIHKSKGLEFPVVFVSGLGRRINQTETSERMVLHADLGMGLCEIAGRPRVKRDGIFRTGIADRIRRENLGEELRVLYVAMTRAKEKLILTGLVKDMEKTLGKYTGNVLSGRPVSYRQRALAVCYLDWVIPALMSYPEKYRVEAVDCGKLVFSAVGEAVVAQMEYGKLLERIAAADEALTAEYEALFSYEYPYVREAGRKSKYSVSELKHDSMVRRYDLTEAQAPDFLRQEKESYVPVFVRTSRRKEDAASSDGAHFEGNRGALRGTAVHRVMECLDFAKMAELNRADDAAVQAFVDAELARMTSSGELSEECYALVIPSAIERFVESDVAARMAAAAVRGDLYREKPFVMQYEDVLVQGIIDVFWMEEDAIILLDYKTDRVACAAELADRYETQLSLYADALERVFSDGTAGRSVKEKLIYSFRLQEVVGL